MKQVVTAIKPKADPDGNYSLELTAQDGSKAEVIIPPAMEQAVMLTIQENVTRRRSSMSPLEGFLVLDVAQSMPRDHPIRDERALLIEIKQLGAWALRMERRVIELMIGNLEKLLAKPPQRQH